MSERVIIIGAGVMGCACGWRLLQRGFQVTLLERALPGAESSAAAAGILGAQSEVSGAGPLFELALASRALFPAYVEELHELTGIEIGYERSGVLEVALDPGEGRLAVGRAEWMMARGVRVDVLDREEARRLEPALSPTILGANFYPDDHQLEPERLARALSAAVGRLGGQFLTGQGVIGVAVADDRVIGVTTESGVLPADHVVVAAGAWSSRLQGIPPLRTVVKPMSGQIVQVDMRPPALRHVIYGYQGYIVPRADGRVIMGSTLEDRGFDKAVTTEGLQRITSMAMALVPPLGQARLISTWAGLRPATRDNLPLLGQGALPGLYFATGHYRNGILLTPITGEVIARLVAGENVELDLAPFAP